MFLEKHCFALNKYYQKAESGLILSPRPLICVPLPRAIGRSAPQQLPSSLSKAMQKYEDFLDFKHLLTHCHRQKRGAV